MTDTTNTMVEGINKFLFWNWNYKSERNSEDGHYYPDAVLHAKWHCNLQHLCDKWRSFAEREKNVSMANISFYGELDNENRMAFLTWIVENYNDEHKLVC